METGKLVYLSWSQCVLVLSGSTPPPHLLHQTVCSAGRCCSVCVQCVFSSSPSVCTASVRGKLQILSLKHKLRTDMLRVVVNYVMLHWTCLPYGGKS
ncbi:uncharacterized protein LOC127970172 isoform X12 [Carassius gibelio]|uniref:uncharacterized protein LOC127970172 isoform X11 n=1 Tax=Carassius gibelio TaxID=101364 RepID=UPI002279B7CA|nr:uncharacterized protein LOC127970172 isoform X11 [Carassius gibelio]XP_052429340.1 uncharacterized protein LOC127970172 isoform X12 [Carassius gibelio]